MIDVDGDTRALACGPVAERDVAEPGVDRKTVRKYVMPAVAAGITPGGPAKSEREWHDLVRSGSRSWLTPGCGR